MNLLSMYVARESGLHRLSPVTRFTVMLCLLACGLALPGAWTSYLILLGVMVPLALWGRILSNLIRTVWKISWPFILSVFLIQTFLWGRGNILLEVGVIHIYREGILFSFASIGRILLVMAIFFQFAMSTRPDTLMISLKQIGLPGSIAYIIVTTLQIVPRFQARATTILDAQKSRGLETEGNLIVRARALIPLVAPLILSSLVEAEERAIAIEARAFNSRRKETSLVQIDDTKGQKIFRLLLIVLTVGIIAVRIVWQLLN